MSVTHPFVQLVHLDGDELWLLMFLELVKPSLVLDELSEHERQQLLVIPRLSKVLAEALLATAQIKSDCVLIARPA